MRRHFAVLALLGSLTLGCKPRGFNRDSKVHSVSATFAIDDLLQNSPASRQRAAAALDELVENRMPTAAPSERPVLWQLSVLARALREGAHSLCAPEDLVTVIRGAGADMIPSTDDGKPLVLGPALGAAVWSAGEVGLQPGRPARATKIDIAKDIDDFRANMMAAWREGRAPWDAEMLLRAHVEGGTPRSPLISTSTDGVVSQLFGPPFLVIRTCPARFLPLPGNLSMWYFEKELPMLGWILPEEIATVIGRDAGPLHREQSRLRAVNNLEGPDYLVSPVLWPVEKQLQEAFLSVRAPMVAEPWLENAYTGLALPAGRSFSEYLSRTLGAFDKWQQGVGVNEVPSSLQGERYPKTLNEWAILVQGFESRFAAHGLNAFANEFSEASRILAGGGEVGGIRGFRSRMQALLVANPCPTRMKRVADGFFSAEFQTKIEEFEAKYGLPKIPRPSSADAAFDSCENVPVAERPRLRVVRVVDETVRFTVNRVDWESPPQSVECLFRRGDRFVVLEVPPSSEVGGRGRQFLIRHPIDQCPVSSSIPDGLGGVVIEDAPVESF